MELPVEEVDFEQHMRDKACFWNCFEVIIGHDFAVFEFDTDAVRDVAVAGLEMYTDTYNYRFFVGDRQRIAILKGKTNEKK